MGAFPSDDKKVLLVGDTPYWFINVGEHSYRAWEDCRKYGYLSADGGRNFSDQLQHLRVGDEVFAYLNGHGYVGFGTVTAEPVMLKDFVVEG